MIEVAKMTPGEMLGLHDRFMDGAQLSEAEKIAADLIALAASFGAAAFARHPGCEGGATHAMLRAFLTALVDPMHPGLDYLRQDPAAAAAAREGGAA